MNNTNTGRNIGTALVTGATGGIGKQLVERLLKDGVHVRALIRNPDKANFSSSDNLEIVRGDISDPSSFVAAMAGVNTVFHLAGWINAPFKREIAEAVNVSGTEALARAASKAGVQRFVHCSSVAVYGPVTAGTITEDAPQPLTGDMYSDTKATGERKVLEVGKETGLDVVVARPSMVYGPGIEPWTLLPVRSIRSGSPIIIGDGEAYVNATYVDNVVDGLLLLATTPNISGEAFNLSDGETTTWNTFFGHYGKMLGRPVRKLPQALAENGAALVAGIFKIIKQEPRTNREMVGVMTGKPLFSIAKIRAIGYVPKINLEEGMQKTEAWLRQGGYLKGALSVPNPNAPLEERPVVLVTGAASGMGKATALRLQTAGWRVLAGDIDETGLAELKTQNIDTIRLDVTDQKSIDAVVTQLQNWGRVDALLNIAGMASPGPLERQHIAQIEKQFAVNTFGPLHLARAVAPLMRARGTGRIVNISSTNGKVVSPFMGAYSASKFALEALSDALRLELAPFGIKVTVIQPGSVKTPFADRAKAQLDAAKESAEHYRPFLDRFEKSAMWGQGLTPPEKIAVVVERVLRSSNPAPRVLGTLDAGPAMLMARLPDRARDLLFSTLSGINAKSKDK